MESSSLFLSDPKAYAPALVIRGGRLGAIDGVPQMPFVRLTQSIISQPILYPAQLLRDRKSVV